MTFALVSPQKILHDSGFIVQGGGRFHLEYIEDGRVLLIPVEDRAEVGYEIYWNKISGWEAPFQNESLAQVDLERIKENVMSALEFERI